jgi:hypothetical protein
LRTKEAGRRGAPDRDYGSVVIGKVIENDTGYGFDAQSGEFGNLGT